MPRPSRWVQKKWPGLLITVILFLDDNARPHSVTAMKKHIETHGRGRLQYPTIIAGLVPSDFHLFPALKKNLVGRLVDAPCCDQVDRSECAVRNYWVQWTRDGTHARKRCSGASRKTTRREDRSIVRQALVDPTVYRSTVRAKVGVAIVPQTISTQLAEANLKSKRPFRALLLTPEHRQLRLQWCQARSMWNVTD
ncbi:HTH_Tnp_Tc3_2 domain-containing protein [Trichonephila clavipes]|nr:HTH_Tnp_Tc3_2 domain-containing protein [Trichonephila clavipes]